MKGVVTVHASCGRSSSQSFAERWSPAATPSRGIPGLINLATVEPVAQLRVALLRVALQRVVLLRVVLLRVVLLRVEALLRVVLQGGVLPELAELAGESPPLEGVPEAPYRSSWCSMPVRQGTTSTRGAAARSTAVSGATRSANPPRRWLRSTALRVASMTSAPLDSASGNSRVEDVSMRGLLLGSIRPAVIRPIARCKWASSVTFGISAADHS